MSDKTVQLETSLLVDDGCRDCVERLQSLLGAKRGIEKAHVHGDPPVLCLHFDPNLVSFAAVERMAREAGGEFSGRYRHHRFALMGAGSGDSGPGLVKALESQPGVLHANVNLAAGSASVAFDSSLVELENLRNAIEQMGFETVSDPSHPIPPDVNDDHGHDHCGGDGHSHSHSHGHSHGQAHSHSGKSSVGCAHGSAPTFLPHAIQERWTMLLVLGAGLALFAGWVGERYGNFPPNLTLGCYVLAYFFGAYDISTHALPGLLKGRFDTDILMLAAALGAAILGQWSEGAFLLFLFALGHAGEHYALDKARGAVNALADLMPKSARVRRDGEIIEVSVDALLLGDHVVVTPGDRIPVDGRVVKGDSAVDQSPITGESVPVEKQVGDEVFAGTINSENALEVEVTKLAQDNTLARVMQMVAEAQEQKSPTQQFTQRFTARFVPTVLICTVLLAVVPPTFGWLPWDQSFYRAMLLLVASSPCALALGTPATVLAGIGQAARHGVLIKGGVHLENLGSVKTLALDKTGTLTEGRFKVTDVVPGEGVEETSLLSVVGAVEQQSNHPLAVAVAAEVASRGIPMAGVAGLENLVGRGVRSALNGDRVLVGSLRLLQEENIALSQETLEAVEAFERAGKTVMLVSRGSHYLGLVALADTPRAEAGEALKALLAMGVTRIVMLTGDNATAAKRVGEIVGVTEVRAGLLPADKVAAVNELKALDGKLAMVGDGVNDAPALALADVGIAMGGAGTAVALETADVALMSDDLSRLSFAIGLSRASRRVIQQNLAISMGVIFVLILTSVSGVIPLSMTVLAHEGSTLIVIMNALRLLRFQPV